MKYHINGISISEFNLYNIGNLLNSFSTFFLLTGLLIYFLFNMNEEIIKPFFLLFLSVLTISPLLVLLFITLLNIQLPEEYFLMYPLQKVLTGFLFITGGGVKFYIIFVLWNAVFRRRKFLYIRSIVVTVVLFVILFTFSLIHLISFKPAQINGNELKYDVAVVLGAAVWRKTEPSPIFKKRIERAYELYTDGIVDRIQLTGGNAPGELSEAESARNYLLSLGMKSDDILIENISSQTSQQISFIKRQLIENQNFGKVVIVSNNFHLDRVKEISKFFNIKPAVTEANYKLSWEKLVYYMLRETVALLLFWLFAI
ncbi:MAG: YdcF family protein [Ignavibacteria bacterium]